MGKPSAQHQTEKTSLNWKVWRKTKMERSMNSIHRMHPPGKRGAEKNMVLGARLQKLKGELYCQGVAEFSGWQGQAQFSEGG